MYQENRVHAPCNLTLAARASAEKFPGEGTTEKTRPKNNIIKPLSTLLVICMKIQGRAQSPLPYAADA